MNGLSRLRVKIFADGADLEGIRSLHGNPLIKGLTTNPTLMKKAGIADYETFARKALEIVQLKPISFEVFSDEFSEMRRQAVKIASWQCNAYVKIPITNTRGESSLPLIRELALEGIKVNATALMTLEQVRGVAGAIHHNIPSVVSLFCGRIADTGRDPMPMISASLDILKDLPNAELLWASCREVLNIFHADQSGADIITVTHEVLTKALSMEGKDLAELSLETVKMFYNDARNAGFIL